MGQDFQRYSNSGTINFQDASLFVLVQITFM